MKTRTFFLGLIATLSFSLGSVAMAQTTTPKTLILYDAPAGTYQKFGMASAILLRNLLGHFNTTVDMLPIESYSAGKLANYDHTFYLGALYDNPVPASFKADVNNNMAATTNQKTVVWFKYNLWSLAWDANYNFTARTGITFNNLVGMNSPASSTNPNPGFYDTVVYKGKTTKKYYAYDSVNNVVNADPDVGATTVNSPAQALVNISNSQTGTSLPYITKSGKFWYFADLPLSYIGPRDRYMVLTDILHDILGQNHADSHRALVRLEDVGADVSTASMKTLTDYMANLRIPFSIATIARYKDPFGKYNNGAPEDIRLASATNLKNALNYALARGGSIVQHGFTHQSDNMVNTVSGVSGDDYEFWNMVTNTPMANDSITWASTRMAKGKTELTGSGYTPFAWEAPHYQSSALSIKAAARDYGTVYGRVVYYTADRPNLNGSGVRDYAVGQFYPYIIEKDYYGQRVIPENLGNIEHKELCSYCLDYTYTDIITNADIALMVRDGFASFFFHPFLLDPNANVPGDNDFDQVIRGITGLGYTWVPANGVK